MSSQSSLAVSFTIPEVRFRVGTEVGLLMRRKQNDDDVCDSQCVLICPRAQCPTVHSLPHYLRLSSHSTFLSFDLHMCKCICIHLCICMWVLVCVHAHTLCVSFVLLTCIYALTISSYPVILHSYPFLMCLCATAQPTLICHIFQLHFNNSSAFLDLPTNKSSLDSGIWSG